MEQVTINVTETVENTTVIAHEKTVLPYSEAFLTANVGMPGTAWAWLNVLSLELAPDTYLVAAHVLFTTALSTPITYCARLFDGTDEIAAVQRYGPGMSITRAPLHLTAIVTLETTKTIGLRVCTNSNATGNAVVFAKIDQGVANVATGIHAIKIG